MSTTCCSELKSVKTTEMIIHVTKLDRQTNHNAISHELTLL